MKTDKTIWATPQEFLTARHPDRPVAFFCPEVLHNTARAFAAGFPGLVSYAVKANANAAVISNLHAAGVTAYDVASPVEIDLVLAQAPGAMLHYNNPVRSKAEIIYAVSKGLQSYSVDSFGEFDKLAAALPKGCEIAVRLKLPIKGAAYDFGEKFGADAEKATELLKRAAAAGFRTSMTFHPGTQCHDPQAWVSYISACADVARDAGVKLERLNVGGGFPAQRSGRVPELPKIFKAIKSATQASFGADAPELLCEPGRAMVSDAFSLAARIKSIHDNGSVYLNDGIYGGLTEFRDLDTNHRFSCLSPSGETRGGKPIPRVAFGPTCDSLDKLPEPLPLPANMAEEDYILFSGMGAYVGATCTRFNGYGDILAVTVNMLNTQTPRT